MSVAPFPIPADKARDLIRSAANTKNAFIPEVLADEEWPNKICHLQIVRCLEDGEIISDAVINEHGDCEYRMQRVSAGQEIYLTAVLFKDHNEWCVAVKEVSNGDYR